MHAEKIMFGILVGFLTCRLDKLYIILNFLSAIINNFYYLSLFDKTSRT